MQIFFEFESHDGLIKEFEKNLCKARAFVAGQWEVTERAKVELVLIHPISGEWMPLAAEVVYIAPPDHPAVGLEMCDWGPDKAALVQEFVGVPEANPLSLVSPDSLEAERFEVEGGTPQVSLIEPASEATVAVDSGSAPLQLSVPSPALDSGEADSLVHSPPTAPGVAPPHPSNAATLRTVEPAPEEAGPPPEEGGELEEPIRAAEEPSVDRPEQAEPRARPSSMPPPKNVQERVRKLNMRERDTMARTGNLTERVALERAYGGAVWDALLSNNALTGPEIARIAKNGNATIPHLKQIVGNPAWLSKAEVRRALLTNPRLLPQMIERVLRSLPPNELKKIPKQTAYGPKVRAVAARLVPRS